MSIYVDVLISYPQRANSGTRYFGSGKLSCHMTCDGNIEELHRFARSIGLRRDWFQAHSIPHYDLTPNKRMHAVRTGAIETTTTDATRKWRASQQNL